MRGDPAALLRALETPEESGSVHLTAVRAFAARRRVEKAAGRRQPRASDVAGLRGPHWPSAAPPSRPGLIAAVADRHSAFRQLAFPDPALASGTRLRALAGLPTRLGSWASSYLAALGRADGRAAEELAGIVRDIRGFALPGRTPLNAYLSAWLRFGHVLAYAARAPTAADRQV